MAHDLQINVSAREGYTIIELVGEARLDVDEAEQAVARLIRTRPRQIIVDVSRLTFCSSLGMKLLLNLQREAVDNGGSIKLVGLRPLVKTSFGHARLLELFELCPDLPAALAGNKPIRE